VWFDVYDLLVRAHGVNLADIDSLVLGPDRHSSFVPASTEDKFEERKNLKFAPAARCDGVGGVTECHRIAWRSEAKAKLWLRMCRVEG
jgi:hypothetical protein